MSAAVNITEEDLKDEQAFVSKAQKLAGSWFGYFGQNIDSYYYDLNFLFIDSWGANERGVRRSQQKNTLEINYLLPIFNQLIGEVAQLDPTPVVSPGEVSVSDKAVRLASGLINQIFYDNNLKQKIVANCRRSFGGGFGAFFVVPDYKSGATFEKVINVLDFEDPYAYFFDPSASDDCKTDGNYCGYFSSISKTEFEANYPNAQPVSFETNQNYISQKMNAPTDSVRLCDIWVKLPKRVTVALLSDGRSMLKEKAEEEVKRAKQIGKKIKAFNQFAMMPAIKPLEIVETRKSVVDRIVHVRCTGAEILDIEEWPTDKMPGVFQDCMSVSIYGQQYTNSVFRKAQDTQRLLNYVRSEATEAMMTAHHVQFIADKNAITGDVIDMWRAPSRSHSVLLYTNADGISEPKPIPPPQISPAFAQLSQAATMDVQSIVGRYEAARGAQGNEHSGVAIDKRAMYGAMATFVPFHNLEMALSQVSRLVLALAPAVYDRNSELFVYQDGKNAKTDVDSEMLGALSSVNVHVDIGAPMPAQKAAAFTQMMQMVQLNPQATFPVVADLMAQNLDIPNVQQFVDRIRENVVPPPVIAKESGQPPAPPSPEQMMMQKIQQQMPLMQAQNMQADLALKHQKIAQGQDDASIKKAEMAQKMQDMQLEQQRMQLQAQNQEIEQKLRAVALDTEAANIAARERNNDFNRHHDLLKEILKR